MADCNCFVIFFFYMMISTTLKNMGERRDGHVRLENLSSIFILVLSSVSNPLYQPVINQFC